MGRKHDAVAVVRLSAIVDIALLVPALYGACTAHPGRRFVMVTRPAMAAMMINRPANLDVLTVDLGGRHRGAAGMLRLAADLRRAGVGHLVDVHSVLRTWLLSAAMRLRGCRVTRIDKGSRERRRMVGGRIPRRSLPRQLDRYAHTLARAGYVPGPFAGIWPAPKTADLTGTAFSLDPSAKHVAIAPFAAHTSKMADKASMHKLVRLLADRGIHVWLLGGGGAEAAELRAWADGSPNITSLAGAGYGFGAEMALMNHMDCVVAMDSANMHLAAISNAPLVSVWCATRPMVGFEPWHFCADDAVCGSCPDSPCTVYGRKPKCAGDRFACTNIDVKVLLEKILEKING